MYLQRQVENSALHLQRQVENLALHLQQEVENLTTTACKQGKGYCITLLISMYYPLNQLSACEKLKSENKIILYNKLFFII
jgi:hypothetical protein